MDHRAAPATYTHGRTYDRVVGPEFALVITTASHLRQPQDATTESDIKVEGGTEDQAGHRKLRHADLDYMPPTWSYVDQKESPTKMGRSRQCPVCANCGQTKGLCC